MRPRIDCARTPLSPRVANCSRATNALRSRMRRSRNGPTPDLICPCSSAQPIGFHCSTRSQNASTHSFDARLPAPEVEQVHPPFGIEADHHMHGVVAAVRGHRIVGAAVDAQMLARRQLLDRRAASRP